jgi:hypothetical protein
MSRMDFEPQSPVSKAGTQSRSYLASFYLKFRKNILKCLHFNVSVDFFHYSMQILCNDNF